MTKRTKNRPAGGLSDAPRSFEMGFGERLTLVLDRFPSRGAAADVAGVTAQQLAKYVRGAATPPYDVLARLCATQGFSLDWLAGTSDAVPVVSGTAPKADSAAVPYYDVRAGAGAARLAHGEQPTERIYLDRALLLSAGVKPENAFAMVVDGPSMGDTIRDGELILADKSETEPRDDVFVMGREDGVLVKRLQRRADGSLMLISDNPAYPPETLPRDEADNLRLIGRVKLVLARRL